MNTRDYEVLLGGTRLWTQVDARVEPGHQYIVVTDNATGRALAQLLAPAGDARVAQGADGLAYLAIAHTDDVDKRLLALFNLCAEIRLTAPGLVQLALLPDVAQAN